MKRLLVAVILMHLLTHSRTSSAQDNSSHKDEIKSTLNIFVVGPSITDATGELRIILGKHNPIIFINTLLKPITEKETFIDISDHAFLYRNKKKYISTKDSTIEVKEVSNKYPPTYEIKVDLKLKSEETNNLIRFRKKFTISPKTTCKQPEYSNSILDKEDILKECLRLAGVKTTTQVSTSTNPPHAASTSPTNTTHTQIVDDHTNIAKPVAPTPAPKPPHP